MTIRPTGIRGLSLTGQYLKFRLDFEIYNPTNEAFAITGGSFAKIKRVMVYRQGKFLGMANVDIDQIEIPAISILQISDIPFQISLLNAFENISTLENFSIAELTVVCVAEVVGREYIIEG